jgi:hypothetical protein
MDNRKLDQLLCQKLQRPPRPTFGGSPHHRDKSRLASAIELRRRRISRLLAVERSLEPLRRIAAGCLEPCSRAARTLPPSARRSSSDHPRQLSAALAHAIFRALARPFDTNAFNPFHSSSVRRTMYLFTIHTPSRPYGRSHPIPAQLAFSSWMRH